MNDTKPIGTAVPRFDAGLAHAVAGLFFGQDGSASFEGSIPGGSRG